MIWITSDTHFGHKNICSGESTWEDKSACRKYESVSFMNRELVMNINKYVMPDDTLYHLGDWSFGGIQNIWNFRKHLQCKNIHLILGNHDHHIKANSTIFVTVDEWHEYCGYDRTYYYETQSTEEGIVYCIPVKDLFSSVSSLLEVKINSRRFTLCHYAMRVWDNSHRGSIMLYGHSHGTLDALKPEFADPTWIGDSYYIKNARTMDVGIDTHPDFRPYSITEIIDIMKHKDILIVDHHDGKTS